MKTFAHADLLWSAEQLRARQGSASQGSLILLDVRPTHQVMEGALPGAVHLDVFGIGLSATTPVLWDAFVELLRSLFSQRGVVPKQTVCVYEHERTGHLAARAFCLLAYLGHEDVHVLDGGLSAWQRAGGELSHTLAVPQASPFQAPCKEDSFISADGLNEMLGQPDLCVLDTRSEAEYLGHNKRGGPRGGTIPGSVHVEWRRCLQADGRLKPPAELHAMYEREGLTPDKCIVPFCQGGYRAAQSYFVLQLLGYPHLRCFIGSWREWGARMDLPIVVPQR